MMEYDKLVQKTRDIHVEPVPQRNEQVDDIMSELQTLKIAPQIQKSSDDFDDSIKTRLLDWLIIDVRLLRPMNAR